uniref:Uncharacterized protein n=1 Tax=Glossina austeni TaxID=7395 RepID=A0A1A9VTV6_GLOAU
MNNLQVDALIRLQSQVVEIRAMIKEFNGDENPSDIRYLADHLTRLRNKLTNFLNYTRENIPSVEVTLHRTKLYTIEAHLTDTVQQIIDMAYTFKKEMKEDFKIRDWHVHLTIEKGSKQQQRERTHKRIAFISSAIRFIAIKPSTIALKLPPLGIERVTKAIARSARTYKEMAYAAVAWDTTTRIIISRTTSKKKGKENQR